MHAQCCSRNSEVGALVLCQQTVIWNGLLGSNLLVCAKSSTLSNYSAFLFWRMNSKDTSETWPQMREAILMFASQAWARVHSINVDKNSSRVFFPFLFQFHVCVCCMHVYACLHVYKCTCVGLPMCVCVSFPDCGGLRLTSVSFWITLPPYSLKQGLLIKPRAH